MRLRSVPHSLRLLILHPALAKLFLLNSPANKVGRLNERAEERCHFKVFPLECITELLTQTIANRDGQIEVVTQQGQMSERNKKRWKGMKGVPSISIQCCGLLWRREEIEGKKRRRVGGGLVVQTAVTVVVVLKTGVNHCNCTGGGFVVLSEIWEETKKRTCFIAKWWKYKWHARLREHAGLREGPLLCMWTWFLRVICFFTDWKCFKFAITLIHATDRHLVS